MPKSKLPSADKRTCQVQVKLTPTEAVAFKEQTTAAGYPAGADYLRALIEADKLSLDIKRNEFAINEIAVQVSNQIMLELSENISRDLLRMIREVLEKKGLL
jgi:hypothetical protein